MINEVVADIFLGLASAIVLASALGLLLMRDVYQKLHFVTPAALVAPVLVAVAVFVQQGVDENTGGTLLALLFVMIAGPYLTHATIRAARVREKGDWRAGQAGQAQRAEPERNAGPAPRGEPERETP